MLAPMMPSPMNPMSMSLSLLACVLGAGGSCHAEGKVSTRLVRDGASGCLRVSWPGVDLPGVRSRCVQALDTRRLGVDHTGDRLRPLLFVPHLLRGAVRGVRL